MDQFLGFVRGMVMAHTAVPSPVPPPSSTLTDVIVAIGTILVPFAVIAFLLYVLGVLRDVAKYSLYALGVALGVTAGVGYGLRVVFGDELLRGLLVRDCRHVRDDAAAATSTTSWFR